MALGQEQVMMPKPFISPLPFFIMLKECVSETHKATGRTQLLIKCIELGNILRSSIVNKANSLRACIFVANTDVKSLQNFAYVIKGHTFATN